jgi:hypothetical protein
MQTIGEQDVSSALARVTSGEAWKAFAEAVASVGEIVYADSRVDSDRLRVEGFRFLARVLSVTTAVGLEIVDPAYPRLIRLYDTYRNLANCNPDCIYLYGRVSPEHTYRIYGRRGSALMFEVATMDSDMLAYPLGQWLRTVSQFEVESDGTVEIVLSATPHPKNWVPLDPSARWIYVRQYFYDWDTEEAAELTIERIGASYPAPVPEPIDIARHVQQLIEWIPSWYRGLTQNLVGRFYAGPSDALVFSGAAGGFEGISYGRGYFTCGVDEAVIIEFKPPDNTLYWSLQLGSHYWESLDWDLRQTSLNGHQARLDGDGVFRGVISQRDPGVHNWLDPAGHHKGLICCRVVRGECIPEVKLRTVPMKDLRKHLPRDTPTVTPAERSKIIRQRMLGVQRRFRE